ncbi:MAG: hypothetical protein IJN20_01145 [Oscillospiraceae bacterium]|nr:hypothetical protein [Oscillospiraceae bacterium]
MEKYYKIADLTVSMDTFGRTAKQAEPYLLQQHNSADIKIKSNWKQWKNTHPYLSDEDCEYLMTGSSFYAQLLDYNGLMLHSSAVVVDGKAYLFSANCGTGKSTHTKLWLKQFGEKAYILNDDKPALRLVNGTWYAYGTPWSGKYDISVNIGVPIAGIAMLERSEKNEITPWGGREAIFRIYCQTNRSKDEKLGIKILEQLDKLMVDVPIWKLRCNMEPEAAIVAYEAMSGEKWRK